MYEEWKLGRCTVRIHHEPLAAEEVDQRIGRINRIVSGAYRRRLEPAERRGSDLP